MALCARGFQRLAECRPPPVPRRKPDRRAASDRTRMPACAHPSWRPDTGPIPLASMVSPPAPQPPPMPHPRGLRAAPTVRCRQAGLARAAHVSIPAPSARPVLSLRGGRSCQPDSPGSRKRSEAPSPRLGSTAATPAADRPAIRRASGMAAICIRSESPPPAGRSARGRGLLRLLDSVPVHREGTVRGSVLGKRVAHFPEAAAVGGNFRRPATKPFRDPAQADGVGMRKRTQKNPIDKAEGRGIGPDTKRPA